MSTFSERLIKSFGIDYSTKIPKSKLSNNIKFNSLPGVDKNTPSASFDLSKIIHLIKR